MTAFRRWRSVAALVFLGLLPGCYAYRLTDAPAPGAVARVHMPVAGARPADGPRQVTTFVEGTVVEYGDSIVLAVSGDDTTPDYTLRIAVEGTSRIEVREFSMAKTARGAALWAVGVVAGGKIILWLFCKKYPGGLLC